MNFLLQVCKGCRMRHAFLPWGEIHSIPHNSVQNAALHSLSRTRTIRITPIRVSLMTRLSGEPPHPPANTIPLSWQRLPKSIKMTRVQPYHNPCRVGTRPAYHLSVHRAFQICKHCSRYSRLLLSPRNTFALLILYNT